jgi:hypothetical protein
MFVIKNKNQALLAAQFPPPQKEREDGSKKEHFSKKHWIQPEVQ